MVRAVQRGLFTASAYQGISQPPLEEVVYQCHASFVSNVLLGAEKEIKGCARHEFREQKMKKVVGISFVLVLMTMLLFGCSLKIRTATNGYYEPQHEVRVIQTGQAIPEDAIRIGSVETGEKGMTPSKKCTYSACVDAIVAEAKKMGGNIVYIVSVKEPSVWGSTCYYVTADVYLQKCEE